MNRQRGRISRRWKPEIVGSSGGFFGFAAPAADPTKEWPFQKISSINAAGGKFTHGLGVGDVNGDGRPDLLEKNGWWEQPADAAWNGRSTRWRSVIRVAHRCSPMTLMAMATTMS